MSALILIADDDPFSLRLLEELCTSIGHRVVTAHDGEGALDAASRLRPEVVLLDAEMPNLGGASTLRVLRSDPEYEHVPVLIVVDEGNTAQREEALQAGAFDFVVRPFRTLEVHQRLRNALRLRNAELRASIPPELGVLDPLTRAGTKREMLVTLEYEFSRAVRYGHPLSLIRVLLRDTGKLSNDAHDGLMVELHGGLRRCLRSLDHLFRPAPDAFTALLPETDAQGARTVGSRIEVAARDGGLWSVSPEAAPEILVRCASFPARGIDTAAELLARVSDN